ncbi:MAG TPA: hypothetical protein VGV85_05000 [Longimicrobiaceae bacterium]|nr:hypothetical protein [Longimicrobiaceae bacterium]
MTADAPAPARGRLHYAWTVAGVTFVTLLAAAGVRPGGAFLASGALCLVAAVMVLRMGARPREAAGAPVPAGVAGD